MLNNKSNSNVVLAGLSQMNIDIGSSGTQISFLIS